MNRFYTYLKECSPETGLTQEDQDIAAAKLPLTAEKEIEIMKETGARSENLKVAFQKQRERATVSV